MPSEKVYCTWVSSLDTVLIFLMLRSEYSGRIKSTMADDTMAEVVTRTSAAMTAFWEIDTFLYTLWAIPNFRWCVSFKQRYEK